MAEVEEGDGDKEGEEVDDLRPLGDAERCPAQQFGRTVPMRVISLSVAAVVFSLGLLVSVSLAQRGAGDPQGVAREPTKPKVVSLSGKVLEVKTEPCKMTTGRSTLGTHLIMKTADEKTLNIHLGSAEAVKSVAKELLAGTEVKVEAFRTKKMEKNQYVARSLTIGDRTMELRDKNLRPNWAGAKIVEKRSGKIAVTAVEPSLDSAVDPRFGRCPHFVLVDVEQGTFEAFKNTNATTGGHAGGPSAKMIASKGAKVVLTGKCGPNAFRALSAAGIKVVSECSGTVRDVIKQYQEGKLKPTSDPNAAPRSGAGPRSSAGGGRGRRVRQ